MLGWEGPGFYFPAGGRLLSRRAPTEIFAGGPAPGGRHRPGVHEVRGGRRGSCGSEALRCLGPGFFRGELGGLFEGNPSLKKRGQKGHYRGTRAQGGVAC